MIILVILQQNTLKNKVCELLIAKGFQVLTAKNSTDAVHTLKTHQIDGVITEVDIGAVDGWRLSRLIRSGVFVSNLALPIILVTETYSERIAETTARVFDINRVISYQEIDLIADMLEQSFNNKNNLNTPKKILVIEDTEDTANLIKRMLQHKYLIDIAANGHLGINAFKHNEYDIVLLDIMMPGISGDEVLDVIMAQAPKQVVIIMTAHGTIDLAELMLVKGAADYIQKPFKAEQLRKVCDIAAIREDFIVSNEQFSARTTALTCEQKKYQTLLNKHCRILDSLLTIVLELTPLGQISFVNKAWYKLTGFGVDETIGLPLTAFIHGGDEYRSLELEKYYRDILLCKKNKCTLELKLNKKDGRYFWCEIQLTPLLGINDEISGLSSTIDDISTRKRSEKKLQHIAIHDNLTGVYNRYYFDDILKSIAELSVNSTTCYSLLYIDLDRFKVINDSQGHHQGDLVLKEVALLLMSAKRSEDILCRIGGDEFTLLLPKTCVDEANVLAKDICMSISEASFNFDQQTYKISCSIGISAIDGKAYSNTLYLQQADIAMFVAKQRGRNRVHVFRDDDKLSEDVKQGFEWSQKLQKAVVQDDIVLHFQPIIDVKTRETVYYEALVRLIIDGVMIFPDLFIPSLEKSDGMSLLDRHVIGKALYLMSQYPLLANVAINLSAQAFNDDRLVKYIEEKLAQYKIAPKRVIFELTESASLTNITATQRLVNRLNNIGCSFSIDDFGTGFSTFAYLKQIPASSVKIDGSFVKDMSTDKTDAALVKAIHETAQALNKKSVAEFVENEETLLMLAELGVHLAQGYHIAKPMSIEDIIKAHDNK